VISTWVESGAEAIVPGRPIKVVLDVLLAAPDHLDRAPIQLLGNRDGLTHVVLVSTPSEAAAQETVVEINVLHRNSRYFRRIQRGCFRLLGSHPNINSIRSHLSGAVERFHHRVVQVGNFIDRFHDLGGVLERRFRQSEARGRMIKPKEIKVIVRRR